MTTKNKKITEDATQTVETAFGLLAGRLAMGSGKCAAIRATAKNWLGSRADFLNGATKAGINRGTAQTQYTRGRV